MRKIQNEKRKNAIAISTGIGFFATALFVSIGLAVAALDNYIPLFVRLH